MAPEAAPRLAGSTIPFAELPLREAFAAVRHQGFAFADLSIHHDPHWGHLQPADVRRDAPGAARDVAEAARAAGIGVAALNVNLAGGEGEAGEFEAVCVFAAALGVSVVSLMPRTVDEAGAIERYGRMQPLAAAAGRVLAVETYDLSVFRDLAAGSRVLAAVPGLKLTFDTGHLLCAGLEQASWTPWLPFVAHIHVKDGTLGWGGFQAPVGEGVLDVPALARSLRAAGYAGAWTVEYFGPWPSGGYRYDTQEETRKMRVLVERALGLRGAAA